MCDGVYRKTQEYWAHKEWELMELAAALTLGGWYAAVTWKQGHLVLIVRSQRSMDKWKAEKQEVAQRVIA
jgi:hypothetical protein